MMVLVDSARSAVDFMTMTVKSAMSAKIISVTTHIMNASNSYVPRSRAWFISRIGKGKIYRDSVGACCAHCDHVVSEGLTVGDEFHADYLACTDADFAYDGYFLNYRDEK
ncbi:MAG: hypothetical protein WAV09_00905 [Minisyncoccia bacterium]